MKHLWISLVLALAALLITAGCGSKAGPEATAEQEPAADKAIPAQPTPPEEEPETRESMQLPFALEQEDDVTVFVQQAGSTAMFELSPHEASITLQTLRNTRPTPSADWLKAEPSGPKANIVVLSGAKVYETSFYYAENVLSSWMDSPAGTRYLYAYDTQLSLIFHKLLAPGTAMGKVGAYYEALSDSSMGSDVGQSDTLIDMERLTVRGKDYVAWEEKLSGTEPLFETYFIGFEEELEPAAMYEDGVLKLNLAIAFTEPGYATPDGIEVGTPRGDVLAKLGTPNAAHPSAWRYRMGDYLRFHIYFVDDTVSAILLTMPL